MTDKKYRSSAMKDGPLKAAARSMLRGMGLDDDDITQPFIGVCSTAGEMSPCNTPLKNLADEAYKGIYRGDGTPRSFTTISVSDALVNGHSGMHFSLISREIIADSIETVMRAHQYDGLFCLGGCDKNFPAMIMAMTRLNVPATFLNGGPAIAGNWRDEKAEIKTVAEFTGKFFAGQTDIHTLESLSRAAYPAEGCCAGQFTASTMAMIAEVLGFAPLGVTSMPAVHSQRKAIARKTGRRLMEMVKANFPLPRDLVTRKSLENACAAVAATGGSTNAVLHIPAIANEAGIKFDIDDVAEVFKRTPLIAHLSPSGPYLYPDLHEIGGIPVVLKELLKGGYIHGECLTIDGISLSEALANAPDVDNKIVMSCQQARSAEGGLMILRGNLAPAGAVIKTAGLNTRNFTGKARIFENEEACLQTLMANQINDGDAIIIRNEGPKGGPGMREMVTVTALLYGMGKGETTALITDGRFSGASHGFCIGYVTPEAADNGPIAFIQDGDTIIIDLDKATLDHAVSDEVIQQRRANGRPNDPSGKDIIARSGVAQKYIACVGPATEGAVTHAGNVHWKHELTGE